MTTNIEFVEEVCDGGNVVVSRLELTHLIRWSMRFQKWVSVRVVSVFSYITMVYLWYVLPGIGFIHIVIPSTILGLVIFRSFIVCNAMRELIEKRCNELPDYETDKTTN